jgi:predicted site-specific integrase-resolvase
MTTIGDTSYYNEKEAAYELGLSPTTLRAWRRRGKGPPALKQRGWWIWYPTSAIEKWKRSTSKKAEAM